MGVTGSAVEYFYLVEDLCSYDRSSYADLMHPVTELHRIVESDAHGRMAQAIL
jgi:hypothetical protein